MGNNSLNPILNLLIKKTSLYLSQNTVKLQESSSSNLTVFLIIIQKQFSDIRQLADAQISAYS